MIEFLKARLTQEANIFDRQYCEYFILDIYTCCKS